MLNVTNMLSNFLASDVERLILAKKADSTGLWGKMSLQHTIEHLSDVLKISNGNNPLIVPSVPDHIFDHLRKFLMGKNEFPKGFISPLLGESPNDLRCESLASAVAELAAELHQFNSYFEKNPLDKFYNPTFGVLNKEQWIQFHTKHFTHHFKQFELI